MERKNVLIYENKRIEENGLNVTFPCDYCNRFSSQVAELCNYMIKGRVFICKSCLSETIEILDKNMRDGFQSDFELSRIVFHQEDCKDVNVPVSSIPLCVEVEK